MFTLFFRAMTLYIVMVIFMRVMGRRQLGQFQPYEFAMTILLADVISTPMESVSVPLIQGLVPVGAMFVVHCAISIICAKSDKARAFISGKPSVVISKGIIDKKEMEKLCISLSDLMEGLRMSGMLSPSEVGTAVVEANGTITAFPRSSTRAPYTSEMGIDAGYEGLPMMLVMDGRLQKNNLAQCGCDEKWLTDKIGNIADVYFAFIDTQGVLSVQRMSGETERINAIDAAKIAW